MARADTNPSSAAPSTPKEFFNSGTLKLRTGKLREAEALLETALARQDPQVQPPALYNLGHVRFGQGVEELKKGPAAEEAAAKGRAAALIGDGAIASADEALASGELQKMVAAYIHGRGARKEMKAATDAVRRALEAHGATLIKWQRASGDFKSAVELDTRDSDAHHNAEVVDRCIAKLVDSLRELQQCASPLGTKNEELRDKLKQLKGRIPAMNMPPGASGDDDEDEDMPLGPQAGQKESPSKDGEQMNLSPEQAGWLLEGYKLDSERRLPMGQGPPGQPRDRSRPTW